MKSWIIIGDGPSRNVVDLQTINIMSVGVNRCLDPKNNQPVIPNYLLINDKVGYISQKSNILSTKAASLGYPKLVLLRSVAQYVSGNNVDYVFDVDYQQSGLPKFSKAGPLNFYSLNTGCLAIQWAYQMGAREIGLVGMDTYYPEGDSHSCGNIREQQETMTDSRFERAIAWFDDAAFPTDLKMYYLVDDPNSPLFRRMEYQPFAEFVEGE